MKIHSLKQLLCAAMVLLVPLAGAVQAAENPPPLASSYRFTVPTKDMGDFQEELKEHMAYRAEMGDPRTWQTYTPILGEDLNQFIVRACCFNWADEDAYEGWHGSNPKIMEHWYKGPGKYVTDYAHHMFTVDWSNSHWGSEHGPYKLIAVTSFDLQVSKAAQFDRARDTMSQIALEQGWADDDHVWAWTAAIGGEPIQAIAIPHKNFASMDRDEDSFFRFLSKHMGEDGAAKLLGDFMGAVEESHFQIWRHHEDLSMSIED